MTDPTTQLPLTVRVHGRGDAPLEGVLRLIEEAARPRPLPEVLAALCAEVSDITGCEVVSLYLRESEGEGDQLRMAANVGFPAGAVHNVRLRVGEGILNDSSVTFRPNSNAHYALTILPLTGRVQIADASTNSP